LEKAKTSTDVVYDTKKMSDVPKIIIKSVDHILNHDLVQENPCAATFVTGIEQEQEVQHIKEVFNKDKPIGAAPRWHFFGGGTGAFGQKRVLRSAGYGFPRRKKSSASQQYCKVYCSPIVDYHTG
jgi:hypothetical protein